TEAILTEDTATAERFLREVDSAILLHNASTQFADGGEFGMGAEIGISTDKFHARGPAGGEQLTSYKYVVRGSGQTRPEAKQSYVRILCEVALRSTRQCAAYTCAHTMVLVGVRNVSLVSTLVAVFTRSARRLLRGLWGSF